MSEHFLKVKEYLSELGFVPHKEDAAEELVLVSDETKGISNLVVDCEFPILVLEQSIFDLKKDTPAQTLFRLLQMNRTLVHGAFVIDDEGKKVIFRDTLQLANLDLNELEGSINALSYGMAENAAELIELSK